LLKKTLTNIIGQLSNELTHNEINSMICGQLRLSERRETIERGKNSHLRTHKRMMNTKRPPLGHGTKRDF
jgi:hypothetical protein